MFLVVGPSEEFLFRGIVQSRLRERLSAIPAVAIAGSIFAVVHVIALAGSPSAVAVTVTGLLVPGLVLGVVYEYTGNLVVPWLIHSIHNSLLLTGLLLAGAGEGTALLSALFGIA
jgi:membrane protease YdiL (CAAX protease family)